VFDETNDSQKEQVNLDLVDDEEAPYDALQRMVIGDVRPQDPSNLSQEIPQMILLHPYKVLIKIIMKKMMNQMIKAKRRAMIKGKMRMMGIKEKHHHIQKCIKIFKEITPSTIYLVISKRELPLNHVLQFFCEHYSFVPSFEPFKLEDALRNPDWVVAMQE
jgi:hypothetical protein